MKNTSNFIIRLIFYVGGLIIMTLGVALSVRADLGVSTISSIPYTLTCVIGMDLGIATIYFSILMVIIQIVLLRKNFKPINLLQLPVGILFGLFLTFCCNLTVYIPEPANIVIQLIMTLISTLLVALGIFLYVPAGFIPLAPEGAMLAISKITGTKFANVKLVSDITMVAISLVTCLIVIHELGSVGIGTVLAALLVGTEVKYMTKFFGNARDRLLADNNSCNGETADNALLHIMKKDVYTISENAPLSDALKLFREKKISGAPVVNAYNQIVGFISDGDIMRHLSSEHSIFINDAALEKTEFNKTLLELVQKEVSSISAKKIITVNADDTLDDVCYKLGDHHIKKAPVLKNGEMIGIINVSNIIKYATDLMQQVM